MTKTHTLTTLWINEAVTIPVILLDQSNNPVLGVGYNAASAWYTRESDSAMQYLALTSGNWVERGLGVYALALPGTVPNQQGVFVVAVTPAASSTQTFMATSNIDTRVDLRLLSDESSGYPAGTVGDALYSTSNKKRYDVFANPNYNFGSGVLDFTVWLHEDGELVTTPTSCTVVIKVTNGGTVVASLTGGSPNADGVFYLQALSISLSPNVNYSIVATVTYNGNVYESGGAALSLN